MAKKQEIDLAKALTKGPNGRCQCPRRVCALMEVNTVEAEHFEAAGGNPMDVKMRAEQARHVFNVAKEVGCRDLSFDITG